jgi:hypothetical protein
MKERDQSLELLKQAERRLEADASVPSRDLFAEMVRMGLVDDRGQLVRDDRPAPTAIGDKKQAK